MPALTKAKLQEIDAKGNPGPPIDVQFNPQSLKLALANKVEGGDTRGRQQRQYLGKTSTTLSFDLHFDTADQGDVENPVSVRTQTALIESFVLPKGKGNTKQAPPRCRFSWGDLVLEGVIEDVAIDFELFAANGTPLRAKIGVSIKEQDAKYELLQSGPGANTDRGATPPGAPGTGPGTTAGGPTDSSAQALDGESAADFANRMGLDPSAWRGIAAQLGDGSSLSLTAGDSIDFNASLSAGAGIGISAGVEVGVSASLEASFGLDASVSAGVSAGVDAASGFALSAAGGVSAALESVAIAKTASAAAAARRSFGSGAAQAQPPATLPTPSLPDQPRTPLAMSGALPSPAQQAASAPPPPLADPRATSFGLGVPLRPRVEGNAADLRADVTAGRIPLRPRGSVADVLTATDPSAPPWMQLPPDRGRAAADQAQARRFADRPCGCSCK
jgi:hypothetical protein